MVAALPPSNGGGFIGPQLPSALLRAGSSSRSGEALEQPSVPSTAAAGRPANGQSAGAGSSLAQVRCCERSRRGRRPAWVCLVLL